MDLVGVEIIGGGGIGGPFGLGGSWGGTPAPGQERRREGQAPLAPPPWLDTGPGAAGGMGGGLHRWPCFRPIYPGLEGCLTDRRLSFPPHSPCRSRYAHCPCARAPSAPSPRQTPPARQ